MPRLESTTVRIVEISPPQSIPALPNIPGYPSPAPPVPDQPIRLAWPVDVDVAELIHAVVNAKAAKARRGFVVAAAAGIGIMIGALGTMVLIS